MPMRWRNGSVAAGKHSQAGGGHPLNRIRSVMATHNVTAVLSVQTGHLGGVATMGKRSRNASPDPGRTQRMSLPEAPVSHQSEPQQNTLTQTLKTLRALRMILRRLRDQT